MAENEAERVTISGISSELLKKVNQSAEKNNRDRSKEIVFILEQFYHTK